MMIGLSFRMSRANTFAVIKAAMFSLLLIYYPKNGNTSPDYCVYKESLGISIVYRAFSLKSQLVESKNSQEKHPCDQLSN
jgi:hypothetical protein